MATQDPFHHLGESLQELARRGVLRRWRRGTQLIEEGTHGDTLYIVLSGRLRAYTRDDRDREFTFGTYGPGEYVGEMSLDGGPRSASVETLEASLCATVTRQTLLAYLHDRPEFGLELLGKVIARARAATLSARQLALNDVYGRTKLLLESLAGRPGAPGWHALGERLTHQAIASSVGSSREMVSRVMKSLEAGDHIRSEPEWSVRLPLPPRW